MKTNTDASSKPLALTLDVLSQQDAKSPELTAKQERLLRILATSGALPAASTDSATSDPMQAGIDAHEQAMQVLFKDRAGTSDQSKPTR